MLVDEVGVQSAGSRVLVPVDPGVGGQRRLPAVAAPRLQQHGHGGQRAAAAVRTDRLPEVRSFLLHHSAGEPADEGLEQRPVEHRRIVLPVRAVLGKEPGQELEVDQVPGDGTQLAAFPRGHAGIRHGVGARKCPGGGTNRSTRNSGRRARDSVATRGSACSGSTAAKCSLAVTGRSRSRRGPARRPGRRCPGARRCPQWSGPRRG